ncbi:hypothetical protein ACGG0V_004877 [Salmonella enterica]
MEKKTYKKKTPEQRKAFLEDKLNKVKEEIKKKNKVDAVNKRKETAHLKYILAGNVLKILECDVREVDLSFILGAIYGGRVNKERCKKIGEDILKKWSEGDPQG